MCHCAMHREKFIAHRNRLVWAYRVAFAFVIAMVVCFIASDALASDFHAINPEATLTIAKYFGGAAAGLIVYLARQDHLMVLGHETRLSVIEGAHKANHG